MSPDEKTQKAADGITKTIDSQDNTVQLANPNAPAAPVTEPAVAVEPAPQPAPAEPAVEPSPPPTDAPAEAEPADNQSGISATEILAAPAKPPEPKTSEGREATSNTKVVVLVAGAALLFVVGILLAVFTYVFLGVILVVVAALLVLLAVFLPIR